MDFGIVLLTKAIGVTLFFYFCKIFLDIKFEKSALNDTEMSLNTTGPKVPLICQNVTPFGSTLSYFYRLCYGTFSHWPLRYISIYYF